MNQELNFSLKPSSSTASEQLVPVVSAPAVLEDALLSQVGGGISSGPYGGW